MEGLLESSPKHEGLLLAASSGFVQYAYGWVQMEADIVEAKDLARATELRERARKLYLRARGYGLRGLEVDFPGLREALARDPKAALAGTKKEHVPLLYWTAMGWAGAMSLKVNDSEVSADQPIVEALARRALELDEGWGLGSIHEFFVSWESARSTIGGSVEKAREHYEKALALLEGAKGLPLPHLRRERQRREAGQGAVPGDAGEGARDRREPARRPASRQPPRPEARPLAARAAGRAVHRVAGRTREDP